MVKHSSNLLLFVKKKKLRISRCITFFSSFIVCPLVPSYGALEMRSFQSIPSMPFMILYTSIRSPRILLVSMVVRFRFFSLISYGNLFSSGMHFVNRRWTPSNSYFIWTPSLHCIFKMWSDHTLVQQQHCFSIFVLERPYLSQHLISSFYTMCNMTGWF